MAVGRREQPGTVAALAEDPVGPLEGGDARPVGRVRVDGEVVALDEDLHPVVEPPDHDRRDRGHRGDVVPGRGAPVQAALDGLGDGDRLGHREADGPVDVDAAEGRLLDGGDARPPWPGT